MSAQFFRAVDIILDLEGEDKVIVDTGGLTKYGISQRAYPDLDIRNLTEADAKRIYFEDYWSAVSGDDFAWPLNLLVFDAAVNQGVSAASKMLQKAAGGLVVDGVLGRKTKARVSSVPPKEMAARYMARRALRYTGTRAFDKYGYGWMSRLFRIVLRA